MKFNIQKRHIITALAVMIVVVSLVGAGHVYLKLKASEKQLYAEVVQSNLIELEGAISNQKEAGWNDPSMVAREMNEALNGLMYVQQLDITERGEKENLKRLYAVLSSYPHDMQYESAEVTTQDQKDWEALQGTLRENGFGLQLQSDSGSLKKKIETLGEALEYSYAD
ncbi:hypothetical protein [Salibacterium qingdaonense]|uniref:Uncharacterized protein n=1 Tax=Salibacterium qingdaonense TaxID=266892 RepID=A0A1I4P2P5_9BACI|nr:hypothetical protein [Salibacterium qingdaonense]SFM21820.1 hypothetical protein SAMN04488054_12247 [Salibacterium qingdaonense]